MSQSLDQSTTRFGLTYPNFRRFEPIIKAAVLSYPAPVQVSWAESNLRYTTFTARLRDAMKAVRSNHHWAIWLYVDHEMLTLDTGLTARLNDLELRPHPTLLGCILLGGHEYIKSPVESIRSEAIPAEILLRSITAPSAAPSFPVAQQVPLSSQLKDPLQTVPLKLATSTNIDTITKVVTSYAMLASCGLEGLPKLYLVKDSDLLLSFIQGLVEDYDVGVIETATEFQLF